MTRERLRFTIAELLGVTAVSAVACLRPVLFIPLICMGFSLYVGAKARRVGVSLAVVSSCLYVPFSWLLFIDNASESYHLFWLNLWPILPGIMPATLLFHPHDVLEFTAMGIITLILIVSLTWLGSHGRYWLVVAAGIAFVIVVPQAMLAYAMFRA